MGSGQVVVWGDEWLTYDSEWTDLEDQQVELFWLNVLGWLSPPRRLPSLDPTGVGALTYSRFHSVGCFCQGIFQR